MNIDEIIDDEYEDEHNFKRPSTQEEYEDELAQVLRMSLEETPESTLLQLSIDKEMDEMALAIDRSLDEHPDFLELQNIARQKSMEYVPESHKVRYFDQIIGLDGKNKGLIMDNYILDLLLKHADVMKNCMWCEKQINYKNIPFCTHLFPSELHFFFKLRQVCKQWRNTVDNWLKMKNFTAVSYGCACCSHTFAYKIRKETYDNHDWNRDPRSADKKSISGFGMGNNYSIKIPKLSNGHTIIHNHKKCEADVNVQNFKKLLSIQ